MLAGIVLRLLWGTPEPVSPEDEAVAVGEPAPVVRERRDGDESHLFQPGMTPEEVLQQSTKVERFVALVQFLPGATRESISELMNLAAGSRYSVYAGELRIMIARWSELDPEAALEFARRAVSEELFGSISERVERYFWEEWARVDPEAALAAAEAVGGTPLLRVSRIIRGAPLGSEEDGDPVERARLAVESGNRENVAKAGQAWARTDPMAALDWVLSLDQRMMRSHGVRGVIAAAVDNDPASVARKLADVRNGKHLRVLGETWAATDVAAAAAWVKGMEDGQGKHFFVQGLSTVLAKEDPRAFLDLMEETRWSVSVDDSLALALPAIAEKSPREAMRYTVQMHDEDARRKTAAKIMTTWVADDHAGALTWVASLPDTPDAAPLAAGLGEAMGKGDADNLPRLPSHMPSGARKAYADSFTKGMITQNPSALVGWIAALEPAERKAALWRNVDAFKWKDPEKCAAAYALLDAEDQNRIKISEIGPRFADRDPIAAANWLSSLPNVRANSLAFYLVAKRYGRKDNAAAMQWASSIPDEKSRNSAIRGVGE